MNLRTSLVLLLASGCVSETALEKAQAAFAEAFTPTKSVDLDGGSRCAPVDDLALEGTVHPGYEGSSLSADIAWGEEQATSEKVKVGAGGSWSIPVDPSRLVCTNAVGRCTLQVAVTIVSEEEGDSYKGTSTYNVTIEDDRFEMFPDADGDGYGADGVAAELVCDDNGYADRQGDCNDALDSVNAGVTTDVCNDIDDDCDGDTDEDGVFSNYYPDLDGDGFGAEGGTAELRCDVPDASEMLAPNDADCVDDPSLDPYAAAIHPEADEMCDGFDNDCDGGIDDEDPDGPDDGLSYFLDKDGDGAFHNVEEFRCNVPGVQGVDYVLSTPAPDDVDCDDTDAALNRKDLDLDGFDTCGGDCDDGTFGVNPDADELLGNNFDEDCDGYIGCYADVDNDGHGALTDTDLYALPVPLSCDDAGNDFASIADDCLDEASADGANTFPGNPAGDDPSDGLDNDCSGDLACYIDFDRDDWGGTGVDESTVAATNGRGDCDAVDGLASSNTDCRDDDGSISPGAEELVADGTDQDCDGLDSCYEDQDRDGFGSMTEVVDNAAAPGACDNSAMQLSDNATDCDDDDNLTFPGGTDLPGDDVNQDCLDGYLCFVDDDGDGFGSMATDDFVDVCSSASGASTRSDDCDDTPGSGFDINPDGTESVGNNDDEDCNNVWLCYEDGDGDGFAGSITSSPDPGDNCETSGFGILNTDCDDGANTIFPGAAEFPGDDDNDCDGSIECYDDSDNDTYGDLTTLVNVTVAPGGSSTCGTLAAPLTSANDLDCDPADGNRFPNAPEIACDGVQQDCDGTAVADARVAILDNPIAGFSPDDTTFDGTAEVQLADALANATATETVRLCAGDTYTGSFLIDQPITLEGEGATLDGNQPVSDWTACPTGGPHRVLQVDGAAFAGGTAALLDLTIIDGCVLDAPSRGGGLDVVGGADVSLDNVVLSDNQAEFGGGLAVRGSSSVVWNGGGADDNTARRGGAVWVEVGSTFEAHGTPASQDFVWFDNDANDDGGTIYAVGDVNVSNCRMDFSDALDGDGGAILASGASTTISNCTIDGTATGDGGAILASGASTTISNCTIDGTATGGNGGAILASGASTTISNCTIDGTATGGNGGAILASGAIELSDVDVTGSAGGFGDAIYAEDLVDHDHGLVGGDDLTVGALAVYIAPGGSYDFVCVVNDDSDVNITLSGAPGTYQGAYRNGYTTCDDELCSELPPPKGAPACP